jgi:CRISPR-associated protein Cas6
MHLDLEFQVFSTSAIAVDHGYYVYAGLSRLLPALHATNGIAVHPIRGRQIGDRMLQLLPWSSLKVRTPQEHVGVLVALAGKTITIGDRTVRLGVPKVLMLEPAGSLRSRLVTIKGMLDAQAFGEAVRRQLNADEIGEKVQLTVGKRRTIRIRDKEVVGFEVVLEGLTANESIKIQENGLGGRRHMGCGVFVPSTVGRTPSDG